jgi:predicted dehydrogenase
MNLTPEQQEIGRRNFLKAAAGVPAVAALGAAASMKGPKKGGPVKAALIGSGSEGKVLLNQCQKQWIDIRAICDINPAHSKGAADGLAAKGLRRPNEYQDLKQMLEKEDLEAILIATPLWSHADLTVQCLDAGKHVLCEKMMAWDIPSCHRMIDAAARNKKLLEIGYQRFYNPTYHAAFDGILKKGLLGDVYHIRTVWHRNASWRRKEEPPSKDFDPRQWGYENWDHLLNWRLYRKYSRGLLAELGSHQIAITNWFFEGVPEGVYSAGGVYRFANEGREVPDHVFATFEYKGGRTATFSSIESNKFDGTYEEIMGTKGTLIMKGESESYFFPEETAAVGLPANALAAGYKPSDAPAAPKPTSLQVTPRSGNALVDASESRVADAAGGAQRTVSSQGGPEKFERVLSYRNEINAFCASIRTGTPLTVGTTKALGSASACILAYESGDKKTRLTLDSQDSHVAKKPA